MSSRNAKDLRAQLKNTVQALFPNVFSKEVQDQMLSQLRPIIDEGLRLVKEHVVANLEQHRASQQEAENKLLMAANAHLEDMKLSMAAWQALLADKLEQAAIVGPEFNQELEEKKKQIAQLLNNKSE